MREKAHPEPLREQVRWWIYRRLPEYVQHRIHHRQNAGSAFCRYCVTDPPAFAR